MALWVALVGTVWGSAPAPDSSDTAAVVDDTDPPVEDTDNDFCSDCSTAAELAGEQGGTACGSGCSSQPLAPIAALLPLALVVVRRRSR